MLSPILYIPWMAYYAKLLVIGQLHQATTETASLSVDAGSSVGGFGRSSIQAALAVRMAAPLLNLLVGRLFQSLQPQWGLRMRFVALARWSLIAALLLVTWVSLPGWTLAAEEGSAEPPSLEQRLAKLEAEAPDAALAGHNAWMLVSTALVLFMTAPGLAMFYSGLVRKKNVLGVMMQCIFLMGMMTCLWALYGYSLSFGGDGKFIGNGDYLFMRNVSRYFDAETQTVVTPMFNAGETYQIPLLTHMLFQGMFFIITPALICGAFAERMKFSTMVVFMILWGTIVYCPLCHWVWDGGLLAYVVPKI